MHFGLFCLMTQRQRGKPPAEIYRETVEHVQMAEKIGFEIAWFAEHHFSNYCLCPSPLTMTSYMAGRTSTIKLGPAVIVARSRVAASSQIPGRRAKLSVDKM